MPLGYRTKYTDGTMTLINARASVEHFPDLTPRKVWVYFAKAFRKAQAQINNPHITTAPSYIDIDINLTPLQSAYVQALKSLRITKGRSPVLPVGESIEHQTPFILNDDIVKIEDNNHSIYGDLEGAYCYSIMPLSHLPTKGMGATYGWEDSGFDLLNARNDDAYSEEWEEVQDYGENWVSIGDQFLRNQYLWITTKTYFDNLVEDTKLGRYGSYTLADAFCHKLGLAHIQPRTPMVAIRIPVAAINKAPNFRPRFCDNIGWKWFMVASSQLGEPKGKAWGQTTCLETLNNADISTLRLNNVNFDGGPERVVVGLHGKHFEPEDQLRLTYLGYSNVFTDPKKDMLSDRHATGCQGVICIM